MADADKSTHMAYVMQGLEHLAQGVTIFDQNLKLVAWNSRFLNIYGYPKDMAFPGADFASFIAFNADKGDYGPGDRDTQVAERVAIARQLRPHRLQRRRADGNSIEIVGEPLPNGGFVTTYTDITETVRQREKLAAEIAKKTKELQLNQQRLSLIADEVPAGIAHIDHKMNILYANKRFARAYGRDAADIEGINTSVLLHPKTLSDSRKYFEQARRGALVDFEMQLELPDGRQKDIRTLLRPEKPSSGEVIGFYLLSIDITRRKATSRALMRSQKMDALGRLASGISHDFNNLLTVILGNLDPLVDKIDDVELVTEFLNPAIAATRRGSSLTRRLLTIARREELDPVPTEISEAIEQTSKLLEATLPAGLTLQTRHAEHLPPALVDRSQLEMALLNLTMNARDATEGQGTISIVTDLYQLPPDEANYHHMRIGQYIRIRFSDDGCGIPPEMAERIFEPFITSKAAGKGSGLGLSMVHSFIRRSNGAIWVNSKPGSGTCFTMLIPELEGEIPVHVDPVIAPARLSDRPHLILLADDDPDVRRALREQIKSLGHHMVEASSGDEAAELISQVEGIDIVLSDVDMPGRLDGCLLAAQLRQDRADLPIILMSGNAPPPLTEQGLANTLFLSKPFTTHELSHALNRAVAVVSRDSR